jgi:hypothetical protein
MNIGLRMNLSIGTEQELLLLERDEQLDRQFDQLAFFDRSKANAGMLGFISVGDPEILAL